MRPRSQVYVHTRTRTHFHVRENSVILRETKGHRARSQKPLCAAAPRRPVAANSIRSHRSRGVVLVGEQSWADAETFLNSRSHRSLRKQAPRAFVCRPPSLCGIHGCRTHEDSVPRGGEGARRLSFLAKAHTCCLSTQTAGTPK